ncbi:MAG: hypothetical protein WC989_02250 [Micavibrio sp.]
MSKDDEEKKRKSIMRAAARAFVDGTEKLIQEDARPLTRYLASKNARFIPDETIHRLIIAARPVSVEKIPFEDGTHQFRVTIERGYLEALKAMDDVANMAAKPFEKPFYIFNAPRHGKAPEPSD